MWIKVCANTSLEDATLAVEAGANAVGFVFAESPRRVTREQVREIAPRLPQTIEKYGVFVDAGFDEIVATVRECGLTGVQLHSTPDAGLPLRLREYSRPRRPLAFRMFHRLQRRPRRCFAHQRRQH